MNLRKDRGEERVKVLCRAYTLLKETSVVDIRNEKLRRDRLCLPKPCTIDGVLKEHSKVLSNLRKERLKKLLDITNTLPQPQYMCYDRKMLKNKENLLNYDLDDDKTILSGGDSLSGNNDNFTMAEEKKQQNNNTKITKKSRKRFLPNVVKKPKLPTIKEEIIYEACDLGFYIDLVCNCMDVLIPTTTIQDNLKDYRKVHSRNS